MASKKKNSNAVRRRETVRYYDYNLLASVILLTCFGLVMLYSTSAYTANQKYGEETYFFGAYFFGKQALISAVFLVAAVAASYIPYHVYAKFALPLYGIANLLLIATKYVGQTVNGATRWIKIGPLQFQTAEIAKLAVILFLPVLIVKFGRKMKSLKAPAFLLLAGGISSLLTWQFTDNLSTAIIIAGITVILVIVAHPQGQKVVVPGVVGLAAVVVVVRRMAAQMAASGNSFRWTRILVWLDPEQFSEEGGYQIMQALYALGSGGFFGKGLGNSAQKLGAVPEAQNDMIFAIVCEELGVFGAALLTLMFIFLLYRLLFIAQNAPDLLGSLIVTGIFAHIALQVILNIAVVINLIPTTGITLPFVSYGGTSIMFLMAEMSLALSVSRQIRFEDDYIAEAK